MTSFTLTLEDAAGRTEMVQWHDPGLGLVRAWAHDLGWEYERWIDVPTSGWQTFDPDRLDRPDLDARAEELSR